MRLLNRRWSDGASKKRRYAKKRQELMDRIAMQVEALAERASRVQDRWLEAEAVLEDTRWPQLSASWQDIKTQKKDYDEKTSVALDGLGGITVDDVTQEAVAQLEEAAKTCLALGLQVLNNTDEVVTQQKEADAVEQAAFDDGHRRLKATVDEMDALLVQAEQWFQGVQKRCRIHRGSLPAGTLCQVIGANGTGPGCGCSASAGNIGC